MPTVALVLVLALFPARVGGMGVQEGKVYDAPPAGTSSTARYDPDEERRLFYVAVTRAMDELFISYCTHRTRYGKQVDTTPSRYLSYIPVRILETVAPRPGRSRQARDAKRDATQLPLF